MFSSSSALVVTEFAPFELLCPGPAGGQAHPRNPLYLTGHGGCPGQLPVLPRAEAAEPGPDLFCQRMLEPVQYDDRVTPGCPRLLPATLGQQGVAQPRQRVPPPRRRNWLT